MIDFRTAVLIASRIQARKSKCGLLRRESFGIGQGFQLKSLSQLSKRKSIDPDLVGVYDRSVTVEQIIVDWGYLE